MTLELGQPCWRAERVAQVITTVAKTDSARVHDFLATHAPVLEIVDERQQRVLSEEQLHRALWDGSRLHTLAVVFGDPGTGKSHLIHWLKLRCEQAVDTGELSDIQAVLIQRRTGSLKDALEQLVEQLPPEFQRYLDPIQRAIGNISQATARQLLAQKLALELSTLWLERKRPALPPLLRKCAELCASTGTRDWLCRDGGVIDRNVRRLTQESSVDDRTSLPEFTAAEFRVAPTFTRENTPAIRALLDELEDSPDLVNQLVEIFNLVLRDALNEMSGLGGARLRDLFDQIRLDLKKSGRTLALYVEDVSVMSSLDKELFHAVEPQSRSELCPMVAVLGMTHSGKKVLADNEKERITHQIAVGRESLGWERDQDELARFTARYLNAVRLDELSTRQIAQQRRAGADVTISACTDCPVRASCHERFGAVEFGSVAIGLFPLTNVAPKRLLEALDGKREGVRPNPRGFLEHLLRPLLKQEDLEQHEFPRASSLPLAPIRTALDWEAFETRYCATYSPENRRRLKLLAQAWVEDGSAEDVAQALKPLLQPLHLPELPVVSAPRPATRKKLLTPPTRPKPLAAPQADSEPRALRDLSDSVEVWRGGAQFQKDTTAKELLYKFLRSALPIEEFPGLPRSEFDRLLSDRGRIEIEGQASKSAVGPAFYIHFPRDAETAELILALARAEYLGRGEWNFPHAEHHKRVVARWFRRHSERVLRTFQPENLDPTPPIQAAVQILGLAALLRRRSKLPQELPELVRELLIPLPERPASASSTGDWKKLLDTLYADHAELLHLVLEELNVPQGAGTKVNFINPLPLIQAARTWLEDPRVVPPAPEYFERFWKLRYAVLERAGHYARIPESLELERAAVRAALKSARDTLAGAGLSTDAPGEALTTYCEQLLALRKSLLSARVPVPDAEFDSAKKEYATPEPWAKALDGAAEVLEHEEILPWLIFDPQALGKACDALARAERFVARVGKEIAAHERPLVAQGDPDQLEKVLMAELEAIGGMDQSSAEVES